MRMNAIMAIDMIGYNGRVNPLALTTFALRASLTAFLSQFRHPFLVGRTLVAGDLQQQAGSETLCFKPRDTAVSVAPPVVSDSLTHAFYALRRRMDSKNAPNVVTLGRGGSNDLIIADYCVSAEHAQIFIEYGKYFLVDIGSLNGTTVNDEKLVRRQRRQLLPGDVVGLGRIAFVFVASPTFHEMLRHQQSGVPVAPAPAATEVPAPQA